MKNFFITGTDTDIGKTYVSSHLFYNLIALNKKCCYFKPIQTGCEVKNGELFIPDINYIKENISNRNLYYSYALNSPVSPHLSSSISNITIKIEKIINDFSNLKKKYDYTIIEGAGGIFAPINSNYFMINLLKDLNIPSIIVTSTKVGTLNHTILTINALNNLNIKIGGLIFNNFTNNFYEKDNITFLTNYSKIQNILILRKNEKLKENTNIKIFIENI